MGRGVLSGRARQCSAHQLRSAHCKPAHEPARERCAHRHGRDDRERRCGPVPDRVLGVQKQIDRFVSDAIEAHREAARLLELAKTAIENQIGQGGGGKGR